MKEGETNIISLVLELYTEIVDCSSRMASCIMYNFYYVKFEKKMFYCRFVNVPAFCVISTKPSFVRVT